MTPEQEEAVRRALAAAARAEDGDVEPTMPPEVAARLDDVLADLVDARSTSADGAVETGTDELAARRARRWPTVLVAAAAVAVIAAGGGAVAIRGLDGSASDSGGSTQAESRTSADQGSGADAEVAPSPGGADSKALAALPEPRLRSRSLAADVQRVADAGAAAPSRAQGDDAQRNDRPTCTRPAVPRGADVIDVRLDGRAATLVLDPPSGGTREARVYSCDDGTTPVAATTVRAP